MTNLLKQQAIEHGEQLQVVPAFRLDDIKREIRQFEKDNDLNVYQKSVIQSYQYTFPYAKFTVQSIIVVASPTSYTTVEFLHKDKRYSMYAGCETDSNNEVSTYEYVKKIVNESGYKIARVYDLPFKRLAVHSGLAVYGKNNITYVDGMGSYLSYYGYLTDMPCGDDFWRDISHADKCSKCGGACVKACPTNALTNDRYLLDTSKCLSYLNNSAKAFPKWLPDTTHHSLYDCFRCQVVCPMNAKATKQVVAPIQFDEVETNTLLHWTDTKNASKELLHKITILNLDPSSKVVPRNILKMFDLIDNGYVASLYTLT